MKKTVLFIVALLLFGYLSPFAFAQSVSTEEMLSKKIGTDGLVLGMKQSEAIFEIGKMGNFTLADKCEHPQGGELLYYLCQKQKIAYVICVNTQGLIWGIEKQFFVNENYVESTFKSQQADLLYRYGTPIINEMTHIIWRGEHYKVELKVQPAQYEYNIREMYILL